MALPDRAASILPLLANEPKLRHGNIILVGHSLGGLVIEQVLRQAESEAPHKAKIADFLRRVRKVAFIGTPHRGSDQASLSNLLRSIFRPRETVAGLGRNDPYLLNLNSWFRNFRAQHSIEIMVLQERRPLKWLGTIVKPDSGDPGLAPSNDSIPLDEDHVSIVKPGSRESDVYKHIKEFVSQPPTGSHADTLIASRLDGIDETIRTQSGDTNRMLEKVFAGIGNLVPPSAGGNPILDEAVRGRLLELRRGRHYGDFDVAGMTRRFTRDLTEGELSQASKRERVQGLAWCARLLSLSAPRDEVQALIQKTVPLGTAPEVEIALAFATASAGDKATALSQLQAIDSPLGRSAAFILATRDVTPKASLDWFEAAGLSLADMDGDGKLTLIQKRLEAGEWSNAIAAAEQLTEEDYEQTPALLRAAATAHLIQAVPDELKHTVLWLPPFHAGSFPLGTDTPSLSRRRTAQGLFERAAEQARKLGCNESRQAWEDMAIWLALRDPDRAEEGRARIASKLGTPEESLHYVPMALEFGFKLDPETIRKEIERRDVLAGGKSRDAMLAGLALVLDTGDPRNMASYIGQNRTKLVEVVDETWLDGMHIRTLAASDQVAQAESLLSALAARGLDASLAESLRRSIEEAKGVDTISAREDEYRRSPSVDNLGNLVAMLQLKNDWPRLVDRAGELFERTHDLAAAHLYGRALVETKQDELLVTFLDRFPELLTRSDFFPITLAWALFRIGSLDRSSAILTELRSKRDDENDRALFVNLAVTSGDWESLIPFVESEWERRHDRTPEELLSAGQLGTQLGSPRAKELILEAAAKAGDNAKILLGCYGAAVKGSWEDDPAVHGWMERAAALSGPDGPIQRISLQDLAQRQSGWEERQNNTVERLLSGNAPMFVAARALNRTLVDLFLVPAFANLSERDVRRRSLVPAYSGARGQQAIVPPATLAIEPSALMTLVQLDLLKKTLDHFAKIYIPHSTLGWLFEEVQNAEFHQPSRVTAARKLKQLIDSGHLQKFEASVKPDVDLIKEVGNDLASLLAVAETDHGDKRQRMVVRPYPVYRVGSLMGEVADVADHEKHICGCIEVISALRQRGELTAREEERARSYITLQEGSWPNTVTIEPNAVLYLDELAIAHLQPLGVLERLKNAGFTTYVATLELDEMDALVRHGSLASTTLAALTKLRRQLSEAITSGKIVLGKASRDDEDIKFRDHPTALFLQLGGIADALLVDDRFLNQHALLEASGKLTPVVTTLDLIDYLAAQGTLTATERLEARTLLRKAGYSLIPVEPQELSNALEQARIVNGKIVETAELRALRESVLRVRMSEVLQMPKEFPWLESIFNTALEVMRKQWNDDIADLAARARSDWLYELYDSRGWAHRLPTAPNANLTVVRFRFQVWGLLAGAQNQTPKARRRYLKWLDEKIFSGIRETDSGTYEWILAESRNLIDEVVRRNGDTGETDDS